jgi:hypothetical protein
VQFAGGSVITQTNFELANDASIPAIFGHVALLVPEDGHVASSGRVNINPR